MEKVKKIFSKMFNVIKSAFNQFPITVILISILTVIFTFENELFDYEIMQHIVAVIALTMFGTVLSETILSNNKKKKYVGIIFSNIIAIVFDRMVENKVLSESILARWAMAYTSICSLISVYWFARKNEKLEKYVLNTFLNIKKHCIIYGIVCIGIIALYGIFSVLIGYIEFDIVGKAICLFTGFYLAPAILNSFTPSEQGEDTKFNKTLFTKVFLILLCFAIAIVYIYIVKLIFVTGIPKNELFVILSSIFVVLMPLCVINKNYYEENKVLEKVIRLLPVLFIPFIFLQIYSMGLRINAYGITDERYLAIFFMMFEIFSIFTLIYKNGIHLKKIFIFLMVFSVIAFISPLNYERVTIASQENRVKKYVNMNIKFENLELEDQRKYAGAYQYLNNMDDYEFEIPIKAEERALLKSFNDFYDRGSSYLDNNNTVVYEYYKKDISSLDISKYSRLYKVNNYFNNSRYDNEKNSDKFLITELSTNYNEKRYSVDLRDLAKKIIDGYSQNTNTSKDVFEANNLVKIDDTFDLFIENMNISFDVKTGIVKSMSIDGFILERK